MLIKGGLIYPMTGQAPFVGDILVRDDRIEAVATDLAACQEESSCILDASGMTILPGLIDVQIHDGPETDDALLRSEGSAGVTCGLLWPEGEGPCKLLTTTGSQSSRFYAICPEDYTDAKLHERFLALANDGFHLCCEISSAKACRRILAVVHSTGVKALLAHLNGCEELLEAIALSGCKAVVGVSHNRVSRPWELACRLDALGVPVAVTCGYPNAKLRHLPLCGALCVREGMTRERALHTMTTAPAGLLGLPEAGRIQHGSRADLAIYDGDPLLLATSHVMTIAGGKIRH